MTKLMAAMVLALLPALWGWPAAADEAQTLGQAAQTVEVRRADAWLGSMAAQLQLTPAQQPAFAAYATAIRAQAELKAEHRTAVLFVDTAQLPPAPEALERVVARLQQRAQALAKVQAAAATLYAQLGAQQRIAFDFLAVTPTGIGSDDLG